MFCASGGVTETVGFRPAEVERNFASDERAADGDCARRRGTELDADSFGSTVEDRRTVTAVTVTRLPEEGAGGTETEVVVGSRSDFALSRFDAGRWTFAGGMRRAPNRPFCVRAASSRVFCMRDLGCDGPPPVDDTSQLGNQILEWFDVHRRRLAGGTLSMVLTADSFFRSSASRR